MRQYEVYKNPIGDGYLLNVQSDLNAHFATRVVIPLFLEEGIAAFAKTLNPVFTVNNERVVMMTQGLAAVPNHILQNPMGSLESKRMEITAALDLLFQGF